MNRVVLFSDVHGNSTGLKAIFEEIKTLENVTHIIGCGDYFDVGAGADEIVDICLENKLIMLQGNHEDVLKVIDNDEKPEKYHKDHVIFQAHEWLKKWLKKEYYDYVIELPLYTSIKLNENYDLLACHASKSDMYSQTCASFAPIDTLRKTYGHYKENIIVYGHHHESHVIPLDGKLLINCASVGARQNDNLSNYVIIEYDEDKISIIQRKVPYDIDEYEQLKI